MCLDTQWRNKGERPPRALPLLERQFRSQMYYTDRGAYIFFAPGGNTPCSATADAELITCTRASASLYVSL